MYVNARTFLVNIQYVVIRGKWCLQYRPTQTRAGKASCVLGVGIIDFQGYINATQFHDAFLGELDFLLEDLLALTF